MVGAIVGDVIDTVRRGEASARRRCRALQDGRRLEAYFLEHDQPEHVRVLCEVLAGVPTETLERVVEELVAVDDPVFWELTDRVVNFDYVEPESRARLPGCWRASRWSA